MKTLSQTTAKNRYLNEITREIRRSRPLRGSGVTYRQRSSGIIVDARPGKSGRSIGGDEPVWLP